MKDYKEIQTMLEKAENEMEQRKQNLGTQYLNGVIAALKWILFNSEQPID